MCLGIAINSPQNVLASGEHAGHEWFVVHNGRGYRCGYIKVEPGHPWFGRGFDLDCDVHGGVTFAEADTACEKEGLDNGWWLGFDCAHAYDLPDLSLPMKDLFRKNAENRASYPGFTSAVCGQHYVENECRSFCEQAAEAAK